MWMIMLCVCAQMATFAIDSLYFTQIHMARTGILRVNNNSFVWNLTSLLCCLFLFIYSNMNERESLWK